MMSTVDNLTSNKKITKRVVDSKHPFIRKRIEAISKINYQVYTHPAGYFRNEQPVFTIILTIYEANIEYIKESLRSVFEQTYYNTEIVLINNGAKAEVGEIVRKYYKENANSKLLETTHNYYDPSKSNAEDPIPNLWNAGLFCSEGEYVYFLSYDDKLSNDYAERMVKLFEANSNCLTAAPMVNSINEEGQINKKITENLESHNIRGKYTDGIELAKSYMKGENKILFPGGLLAIKSTLVLECGGFDNFNDLSQVFKFAIHGDSGFDPEAKLFWRHHLVQANKIQKKMGLVYYKNTRDFLRNYDIENLHTQVAGKEFANDFLKYYNEKSINGAVDSARDSIKFGIAPYLKAIWKLIMERAPIVCIYKVGIAFPHDFIYSVKENYTPAFIKKIYKDIRSVVSKKNH